jgi:4-hydroxy-2-oxoheptanedioate aldolase
MNRSNPLRRRLNEDRKLFGCWLQLSSPPIAEMMALIGYDLVVIDMEHGPAALSETADMMRGISRTDAGAMVRVPHNDPVFIKRLLDQGPDGIMIPMIETSAEAKDAVAACRYPPRGKRGWAAGVARASLYGLDVDYTLKTADGLVVACQIESVRAVHNIEAICAVEGVDVIFIGRNDLAADSGHILNLDHPDVNRLVAQVVVATRRAGLKLGTVPSAGRSWSDLFKEGFDIVLPSGDISLLRDAAFAEVAMFRRHAAEGSADWNV